MGVQVPPSAPIILSIIGGDEETNIHCLKEQIMTASFRQIIFSRLALWLAIAVAGGYFLYTIKDRVKFGIDLVGGTYITLEVQLDKARESELVEKSGEIAGLLSKNNVTDPLERSIGKTDLVYTFESLQDAIQASDVLMNHLPDMLINQDNKQITCSFSEAALKRIDREAVESNIIALNSRIDQFGVGETLIARQGENRIIVELPNVHNPQEAKAMIGRAALLEIKVVEDIARTEQELFDRYDGDLPDGTEIVPGKSGNEFYLLPRYTDITGKLLKTARMGFGGQMQNEPVVEFEFKPAGADRFYDLTSSNIGRNIAVVIDGVVITAPVVNQAISKQGVISGGFSAQSAQILATLLRSGAFVAPVTFEEERHIGPSLGQESINKGLVACGVTMLLIFIFAIVVYKMAGLLAFIVLLYNLLFTLFALSALGATLTLPGIVGMVLTVGMAIDASILIYERIKEELASGATLRKSVNIGFSGAMSVIWDSNITNFLIAAVLYYLGTGPVQGFAVTMIVGIISTLITGLWMLKSLFTFFIDKLGINKISI